MKDVRRAALAVIVLMTLLIAAPIAMAAGEFSLTVDGVSPVGGYYEVEQNGTLAIIPVMTGDWAKAKVAWSSSNESIATVELGVVFASSGSTGTATITATATNESTGASTSQSISVRVIKSSTTKITLTSQGGITSIGKGETLQMTAEVMPTNVKLKWASSKPGVATVNQSGLVKGVAAGQATISVTAQDGSGAAQSMVITVEASAQSIKLNRAKATLYVGGLTKKYKKSATLTAKVAGDSKAEITWASSDSEIVDVNAKGKIVAKQAGTATITATTTNGKSASCKVTVEKLPTKVDLPNQKVVKVGKKLNLKELLKIDGTITAVQWKSANKRVAKVVKGVVLGVRPGLTKIAARTVNGKTAVCVVKVTK